MSRGTSAVAILVALATLIEAALVPVAVNAYNRGNGGPWFVAVGIVGGIAVAVALIHFAIWPACEALDMRRTVWVERSKARKRNALAARSAAAKRHRRREALRETSFDLDRAVDLPSIVSPVP